MHHGYNVHDTHVLTPLCNMPFLQSPHTPSIVRILQDVSWLYLGKCIHAGAMQYFGIKDTDTPAYAIHDAASNSKYLLANASPEDLTSFVAEFEVCCHYASVPRLW